MKTPILPANCVLLCLLGSLSAQNYSENVTVSSSRPVSVEKAQGAPNESVPVVAAQDSGTLETKILKKRDLESVVDLAVLENPSPYRDVANGKASEASGIPEEGVKNDLARISAVYRQSGKPDSNCQNISLSIEQRIKLDDSIVLETVESEVRANPSCACEIVKTAIKASEADTELVVSIVATSITAAPEMTRIISQCAIAAMPESLAGVQALLARYDANAGESGSSSKDSKDAKDAKTPVSPGDVAAMPNPLDFPGTGPVGPTNGGPGGRPDVPPLPPIIITPPLTNVNP